MKKIDLVLTMDLHELHWKYTDMWNKFRFFCKKSEYFFPFDQQ